MLELLESKVELREAQDQGVGKNRVGVSELREENMENPDLSNRFACVPVVGGEGFGFGI